MARTRCEQMDGVIPIYSLILPQTYTCYHPDPTIAVRSYGQDMDLGYVSTLTLEI